MKYTVLCLYLFKLYFVFKGHFDHFKRSPEVNQQYLSSQCNTHSFHFRNRCFRALSVTNSSRMQAYIYVTVL